MPEHFGVDVSADQHPDNQPIDWVQAYAALTQLGSGGRPFAVVKLWDGATTIDSEGNWVNPWGPRDIQAAKAAGFAVAIYGFSEPNISLYAQLAALNFTMAKFPGLPVFIDAEVTRSQSSSVVGAVNRALVAAISGAGGVYTYDSFLECNLSGAPWGKAMWIAEPERAAGNTVTPALFHQYGQGSIPGIPATVDLDYFCGSDADWETFWANEPEVDYPMLVTVRDELTGGILTSDPFGNVDACHGATYYGGCTTGEQVGPGQPNGPIVGIVSYKDGSYVLVSQPTVGNNRQEFYAFPNEINGQPSLASQAMAVATK